MKLALCQMLVGMDNGYYLLDNRQFSALKRVVSLGMPILLFLHGGDCAGRT